VGGDQERFHLVLALDSAVLVANGHVHDAHVGREEVHQAVHSSAGQPVEGIAHGLAIGVEAIPDSTVGGGIAAATHQLLVNLGVK